MVSRRFKFVFGFLDFFFARIDICKRKLNSSDLKYEFVKMIYDLNSNRINLLNVFELVIHLPTSHYCH